MTEREFKYPKGTAQGDHERLMAALNAVGMALAKSYLPSLERANAAAREAGEQMARLAEIFKRKPE